jgi:hypothetical protein
MPCEVKVIGEIKLSDLVSGRDLLRPDNDDSIIYLLITLSAGVHHHPDAHPLFDERRAVTPTSCASAGSATCRPVKPPPLRRKEEERRTAVYLV